MLIPSIKKICLVIIYNHNYEKNIPLINKLYERKFSTIFHLIPFYQGDDPQVIGVYDSSHQFNNYITQAHDRLSKKIFDHYIFVADDMIIRPDLNEGNIVSELSLDDNSAFIPFIKLIDNESFFTWPWALKQVGKLNFASKSSEFRKFLPNLETARQLLEKHGIDWRKGYTRSVLPYSLRGDISPSAGELLRSYLYTAYLMLRFKIHHKLFILIGQNLSWEKFIEIIATKISKRREAPEYPLLWGYTDMFSIPGNKLKNFCHVSGLLASGRVMVEAAIPTAMAFTIEKIVQNDDIGALDGRLEGSPEEIHQINQGSIANLIKNWRKNTLFYHPVKLSQWKFDL